MGGLGLVKSLGRFRERLLGFFFLFFPFLISSSASILLSTLTKSKLPFYLRPSYRLQGQALTSPCRQQCAARSASSSPANYRQRAH